VVKWWVLPIAVAVGFISGLIVSNLTAGASADESIRQFEARVDNVESTNQQLKDANRRLELEVAKGQRLISDLTELNKGLASTNRRLADQNQRAIDELRSAIESVSGAEQSIDDINATVGRIETLVSRIEQAYYALGN